MSETAYVSQGSAIPNELYTLDKSTGALVDIGPIKYAGNTLSITGLAFDPTTGTLYGTTSSNDANYFRTLFTIDETTGAANLIGQLSLGGGQDIAFDSSGQLYTSYPDSVNNGGIVKVVAFTRCDKTNANQTEVTNHDPLLGVGGGDSGYGLAIDKDNRLYLAVTTHLYEINKITGAIISSVTITGLPAQINVSALSFDKDNNLYGISTKLSSGHALLFKINTTTGAATSINVLANNAAGYDALVFKFDNSGGGNAPAVTIPNPLFKESAWTLAVNLALTDRSNKSVEITSFHSGLQISGDVDVSVIASLPKIRAFFTALGYSVPAGVQDASVLDYNFRFGYTVTYADNSTHTVGDSDSSAVLSDCDVSGDQSMTDLFNLLYPV